MKVKSLILALAAILVVAGTAFADSNNPPPPPGGQTFTIPLKHGWNMVSIPVSKRGLVDNMPNPTTNQAGPFMVRDLTGCTITSIWQYSAASNQYVKPNVLDPMTGYWIEVSSDCQITISGSRESQTTRLGAGWNMISSRSSWDQINTAGPNPPPPAPGAPQVINPPRCNLTSSIYNYDPTTNAYTTVTSSTALNDSKGYWVKVQQACQLIEP